MHQTTTPPNPWRDKVWGSEPKDAAKRDNQNEEDERNDGAKREKTVQREGERIRKLTTQRACHRGSNIKGTEWREGERIRKLTTQRACHRGSNIKGAEWDAHGRIAASLPTPRINARQSQPQTTPMYQTTTPPNPWRDKVKSARNQYCTWNEPARGINQHHG